MKDLSAERKRYVYSLQHDLAQLVQQLSSLPNVQKVLLFGSYAAGRRDLFTDLDLLVVMDSPLDFVSRCADLARQLKASVALDILAYTPQEFEQIRDRRFFRQVLKTSKVLYERKS
jgi:predicted nucleotidyltransferase